MEDLVAGDLVLAVTTSKSDVVRIDWKGSSTARQPKETLVPFFNDVCASAESANAKVEMHFAELKYFNSSTITALIHMIKHARERKVTLELVVDRSNHTQRQSFDALKIFGRDDGLLVFRE